MDCPWPEEVPPGDQVAGSPPVTQVEVRENAETGAILRSVLETLAERENQNSCAPSLPGKWPVLAMDAPSNRR